MHISRIDHVQLAMPPGREEEARYFYVGILGMTEVLKPPLLAARGGAWFEIGNVKLHLGVDPDFKPAKKAHVALTVSGVKELREKLERAGHSVRDDNSISGVRRFFTDDAFGNRLEFIESDVGELEVPDFNLGVLEPVLAPTSTQEHRRSGKEKN